VLYVFWGVGVDKDFRDDSFLSTASLLSTLIVMQAVNHTRIRS
jgi:hypothetical protein